MPDAPPVTITDPNDPREPGDLLVAGDDRRPLRLSRAPIAGLVVVALLAGAGVLRGQDRATDRDADRAVQKRAEAALAAKDRYDLSASNVSVSAEDVGGAQVNAHLTARTSDPALLVTGLVLTGTGVTRLAVAPSSTRLTTDSSLAVVAPVSCSASAAGHYPRDWELELEVTPPSGRAHVVRLPLRPNQVREAIRTACDRADPDVSPAPAR